MHNYSALVLSERRNARRGEWCKKGERTVDAKFPNLLLVEAPLHVVHVRVFEQRVARHLGHVVAAVELAIHDAASLLFVKAHKAGGFRKGTSLGLHRVRVRFRVTLTVPG